MATVTEIAPAKINLTLHITGRREDGYHLLESYVAFAGVGDVLEFSKAPAFNLSVRGPYAADLPEHEDNIVLDAAHALAHGFKALPPGAEIVLDKRLPVAAGIGGGSSDAAACIRGLLKFHGMTATPAALNQVAVAVGADVTVCLDPRVSLMSGIGQIIEPAPALPRVPAVLVNPRVHLSTAKVFGALGLQPGETFPVETPPFPDASFRNVEDLADYLLACRNDLEAPAARLVREIGDIEELLFATEGCLIARMSGSGPTCFGLYSTSAKAKAAAGAIAQEHPGWWVAATILS